MESKLNLQRVKADLEDLASTLHLLQNASDIYSSRKYAKKFMESYYSLAESGLKCSDPKMVNLKAVSCWADIIIALRGHNTHNGISYFKRGIVKRFSISGPNMGKTTPLLVWKLPSDLEEEGFPVEKIPKKYLKEVTREIEVASSLKAAFIDLVHALNAIEFSESDYDDDYNEHDLALRKETEDESNLRKSKEVIQRLNYLLREFLLRKILDASADTAELELKLSRENFKWWGGNGLYFVFTGSSQLRFTDIIVAVQVPIIFLQNEKRLLKRNVLNSSYPETLSTYWVLSANLNDS